jgi:hypothetical protein
MDKTPRLSGTQREDLVAYLDGELPEVETQQIDQVLARSEVARHEVEALARTWELLDLLDKPQASAGFTQRTLMTLKVSELRTKWTDQPWFAYVRKGAIAVVWLVVLSVFGVGGYVATTKLVPNPQAELLTLLPLVRNLDLYLQLNDFDYVKRLQQLNAFTPTEAPEAAEPFAMARRLSTAGVIAVPAAELQKRYREVSQSTAEDRAAIERNWATYQQLTPERRAQMQELHRQISLEPESLHGMLETYATWLQTLSPGRRDDLRKAADGTTRIDLVRRYKDEQDASGVTKLFDLQADPRRGFPFKRFEPPISAEEFDGFMTSVKQELPPYEQGLITAQRTAVERYARTTTVLFDLAFRRQIPPDAVAHIIDSLPNEQAKRQLSLRTNKEDQQRELMKWITMGTMRAIFLELKSAYPSQEQLEEFFTSDKIDGETRLRLTQIEPHELHLELVKRYMEQLDDPRVKLMLSLMKELRERSIFLFGPPPGSFGPRGDRGPFRGGPGEGRGPGEPRGPGDGRSPEFRGGFFGPPPNGRLGEPGPPPSTPNDRPPNP